MTNQLTEDDDYDDGGLGEVLAQQEVLLDRHRDHCVAAAVRSAVDHGIDDPTQLRPVAAQFLDSGEAACICDTEPGPVDVPHGECLTVKRALHAVDENIDPITIVFRPVSVAPFGDPAVWDCEHGYVYRIEHR